MQQYFCNLNREQIMDMKEQGAVVFKATVCAPGAVMVPQGWLFLERSLRGPLIFGMRKSFFVQGAANQEEYVKSGDVLGSHDKHAQVLKVIQAANNEAA